MQDHGKQVHAALHTDRRWQGASMLGCCTCWLPLGSLVGANAGAGLAPVLLQFTAQKENAPSQTAGLLVPPCKRRSSTEI